MSGMFLSSCSCTDFFIVEWISSILGFVMNGLYKFFGMMNIYNIGLCIIVFTIVVKLLMLPMTIKQQRFTRLSSLINPEIQAIQKKYRNKTDQESMMRMREETNAVYEKYGTSATGGCMQLLIQMPIIFALYAVIYSIPQYVPEVEDLFRNVSDIAYESIDEYKELDSVSGLIDKKNDSYSSIVDTYYFDEDTNKDEEIKDGKDLVYKQFSNINIDSWEQMDSLYKGAKDIVADIKEISDEKWDELIEKENGKEKPSEYKLNLLEKFKGLSDDELDTYLADLKKNNDKVHSEREGISEVYNFLGINLSKSPSAEREAGVWWALLIPILSAVTQWLSFKISQSAQSASMEENPMASSMKTMNLFMPLMSAFFCYTFPSGLGLYWVISAVVQIVQQIFINMYFNKLDVNDIIKANIEKANKKREKKGLPPKNITTAATANAKNIKYNDTKAESNKTQVNTSTNSNPKKGGIAAKANMVKQYNEKNNK